MRKLIEVHLDSRGSPFTKTKKFPTSINRSWKKKNSVKLRYPDNIISKGKHLNYVTVEGDNPGGDTTIATFMRKFSYPKNIILE